MASKLSPIFSQMLAEQLLTGSSTLFDIEMFNPARFIQERRIVPHHAYSVSTLIEVQSCGRMEDPTKRISPNQRQ